MSAGELLNSGNSQRSSAQIAAWVMNGGETADRPLAC
jgi:hypothetical protein